MMMKKKKHILVLEKQIFMIALGFIEQKRMYLVIQTKYILLRKFKIYTTDKSVFIFDIIVLLH